jgi:uncharacterized protein YrrD
MLILKNKLVNRPVLSLRSGARVATTTALIINPDNLKVEGLYCQDNTEKKLKILLVQDIRDLMGRGLVVNDYEVLADPEDLVRLKSVLEIGFELIGKPIQTENKKKLGKVVDYAVDSGALYVQKIYASPSLLKKISGTLSIDRSQIIEVTNKKIIVKDPLQPVKNAAVVPESLTAA